MEFYKTKVDGVTVLFEKRRLPIVTILVASKVGSAYENNNNKGISHLLEHMVFKGTKTKTARQISSSIEKAGGILNGFTAEEITAFWCKVPSKKFSVGADVIFDITMNPLLEKKELEKERKVVLNEISRTYDIPQKYLLDKTKELLYEKPFGLSVLGTEKTVSKIGKKELEKWHSLYGKENLIVSVVGNAEFDNIKEKVEEYLSKAKEKVRLKKPLIKKRSGCFTEKRDGIKQAHIALGFHTFSLKEKGRYASEIFNAILGEGMSSRLFQEVREKRGLAYAITSYLEQEKSYGYVVAYAGTKKESVKKVREIILKEIKKMKEVSVKEIEEAKEQKIGNWQLELEACEKTATALAFQEIATKAEDFYDYERKILEVKPEEVRKIARIKNYSLAVILPK